METAKALFEFLVSAAGLSVIVVYVTQFAKNVLKLEDVWARVTALVVSVVVGVGASLVLQYGLYTYLEQWWPLVLAIVAASFGGSQLLYRTAPTRVK